MFHLTQTFRYKLPFVIAGFASMVLSIYLWFVQDDTSAAIFVGLWVPSIHSLGTLRSVPTPTVTLPPTLARGDTTGSASERRPGHE